MTDAEKLQALIDEAVASGWDGGEYKAIHVPVSSDSTGFTFLIKSYVPSHIMFDQNEVLFNQDFAKALWGIDKQYGLNVINADWYVATIDDGRDYTVVLDAYQYHLQQMVIAENRIGYAYETVFGDKS